MCEPLNSWLPQHDVVVHSLQRFLTMLAMHGNFNQDIQQDVGRKRLKTTHNENQGSIPPISSSCQWKLFIRKRISLFWCGVCKGVVIGRTKDQVSPQLRRTRSHESWKKHSAQQFDWKDFTSIKWNKGYSCQMDC